MGYYDNTHHNVDVLLGKTLVSVTATTEEIIFKTNDGSTYKMLHHQDCCESVYIESVVGDLQDLVGTPILLAEEVDSTGCPRIPGYVESYTWTFYKFATIKGYVDVRWYGESNGYYSESVDFFKVN